MTTCECMEVACFRADGGLEYRKAHYLGCPESAVDDPLPPLGVAVESTPNGEVFRATVGVDPGFKPVAPTARLTDANDWYLLDVTSGKPLIYQERRRRIVMNATFGESPMRRFFRDFLADSVMREAIRSVGEHRSACLALLDLLDGGYFGVTLDVERDLLRFESRHGKALRASNVQLLGADGRPLPVITIREQLLWAVMRERLGEAFHDIQGCLNGRYRVRAFRERLGAATLLLPSGCELIWIRECGCRQHVVECDDDPYEAHASYLAFVRRVEHGHLQPAPPPASELVAVDVQHEDFV